MFNILLNLLKNAYRLLFKNDFIHEVKLSMLSQGFTATESFFYLDIQEAGRELFFFRYSAHKKRNK